VGNTNDARAVRMAVDAVIVELEKLNGHKVRPDVAVIALPVELIERVWSNRKVTDSLIESTEVGTEVAPNFRGLLKALAMHFSFPIQIVWEDVINPKAKIPRKIKENSDRKTQDRADLAWNLIVTSRTVVWLFPEQFGFEFVPVLHRLQGRLAAQG